MKYENKILDAIETVVDGKLAKASYNKTIQAKVLRLEDENNGKYKMQYQDSIFYAFSGNPNITYLVGTYVYVLIPNNDMSKNKIILSTVEKTSSKEEEEQDSSKEDTISFEALGNNWIDNTEYVYSLNSYQTTQMLTIYQKDSQNNTLTFKEKRIDTYMKWSSAIRISMSVRTNLAAEQQIKGNYGIVFELAFKNNNNSSEPILRQYTLDINNFEGNPYALTDYKNQKVTFDIENGSDFLYINKVYLFSILFPNQNESIIDSDIFIKDLEICSGQILSSKDLSTSGLNFITPNGIYFDDNDRDESSRLIQAQIRIRGELLDLGYQEKDCYYYWFVEDNNITATNSLYHPYGGIGWRCLNVKDPTNSQADSEGWLTNSYTYSVKKDAVRAKENRYKCVVSLPSETLSKIITIINYSSDYDIIIEAEGMTNFYKQLEYPNLICKVKGIDPENPDYSYKWTIVENETDITYLYDTVADNLQYEELWNDYTALKTQIENEETGYEKNKDRFIELQQGLQEYETIMRINRNQVYNVKVSQDCWFKCSVYQYGTEYLGSASIWISNSLNNSNYYNLIINNGVQNFKYNNQGLLSNFNEFDQQELSFDLYNSLGQLLNHSFADECDIKWIVPIKNTLIQPDNTIEGIEDELGENKIYTNIQTFKYSLKNFYDKKCTNNTIQLIINYHDMILKAYTNLIIEKDGLLNEFQGDEYFVRIVPNTNENIYPMIVNGKLNYTIPANQFWFKTQLWHHSKKIFESLTGRAGVSTENENVKIEWRMVTNFYQEASPNTEPTNMTISTESEESIPEISFNQYSGNLNPVNIIEAKITYKNNIYYGYLPIASIILSNESNYDVAISNDCGFKEVYYNEIGSSGSYYCNNKPFEINVYKMIDGYKENISLNKNNFSIQYNWSTYGQYYNEATLSWENNSNLIEIINDNNINLNKNQFYCIPTERYNNLIINNGIKVELKDKNTGILIGILYIPIVFINKIKSKIITNTDLKFNNIEEGIATYYYNKTNNSKMYLGTIKNVINEQEKEGLFVYKNNKNIIDISNGEIILGNGEIGNILLNDAVQLYSKNYWKNYNSITGKLEDLSENNKNNKGFLIDLKTGIINYATDNFNIDANGYVSIKNNSAGLTTNGNILLWAGSSSIESAYLKISQEGDFYCYKPAIFGQFIIDNNVIKTENENLTLNADGTVTGALQGSTWNINNSGLVTLNKIIITNNDFSQTELNNLNTPLIDFGTNFKVYKDGTSRLENTNIYSSTINSSVFEWSTFNNGKIGIGNNDYYFKMIDPSFYINDGETPKNPEMSGIILGDKGITIKHNNTIKTGQTKTSINIVKGAARENKAYQLDFWDGICVGCTEIDNPNQEVIQLTLVSNEGKSYQLTFNGGMLMSYDEIEE